LWEMSYIKSKRLNNNAAKIDNAISSTFIKLVVKVNFRKYANIGSKIGTIQNKAKSVLLMRLSLYR